MIIFKRFLAFFAGMLPITFLLWVGGIDLFERNPAVALMWLIQGLGGVFSMAWYHDYLE